jgi:hypothetical protein
MLQSGVLPEQVVPQPPQLIGSTFVSTQLLPHLVVPPLQTMVHPPFTHCCPLTHAFPQDPQLALSLLVFAQ